MTRPREPKLVNNTTTLNPELVPVLKTRVHNQPKDSLVYMWASTRDPLPFYLNSGSIHEALHTRQKYPGGRYTLQQQYRDILGNTFICIIIQDKVARDYSYQLAHYLYNFFTSLTDPTNQEALFTRKCPLIEPYLLKYTVTTPMTTPPPSTPESQMWRARYKDEFKSKLLKQRDNLIYQKSIEAQKPALERAVPLTIEELRERKANNEQIVPFAKKED